MCGSLAEMCAVSQERLATSGLGRRGRQRVHKRRRLAALVVVALVVLAAVAVGLIKLRERITADNAAVASPVASAAPDVGTRPPNRTIASAGPVDLNLPVARAFAKFTLFRPIDNPAGVAITPDDSWKHTVWPDDGVGPRTAGLDIAAPPQTIVYSPVTGTVTGVKPYVVAGRTTGYQVDISPDAASDVVVRVRHIVEIPIDRQVSQVCGTAGVPRPEVGNIMTAGVTCLGEVIDVLPNIDVARPYIAKYTSDGGNHVHVEVVRVGS